MSTEKQTVFLSGATGFIAQHIVKQLLESNKFKVIGSVRSEEKAKALAKNCNNSADLTFVYVKDISDPHAFDKAFQKHGAEIDFVIHSASPFHYKITDPKKDLFDPAVNGSTGIFKAAAKYATKLQHFVVTSSFAAVVDLKRETDPNFYLNEHTWNLMEEDEAVTTPLFAYCYSKKIAEKAVWDLFKELNVKFGVTSVNPSYVFGPQAFESSVSKELNTSCEYVNQYIHAGVDAPVDESIQCSYIDVRDVARGHIEPLLNSKKFNGERLILSEDRFGNQCIVDILNDIPQLQGKITKGTPHRDDDINKRLATADNSRTKKLLNFKFMTLDKSIKDTALQILAYDEKL